MCQYLNQVLHFCRFWITCTVFEAGLKMGIYGGRATTSRCSVNFCKVLRFLGFPSFSSSSNIRNIKKYFLIIQQKKVAEVNNRKGTTKKSYTCKQLQLINKRNDSIRSSGLPTLTQCLNQNFLFIRPSCRNFPERIENWREICSC